MNTPEAPSQPPPPLHQPSQATIHESPEESESDDDDDSETEQGTAPEPEPAETPQTPNPPQDAIAGEDPVDPAPQQEPPDAGQPADEDPPPTISVTPDPGADLPGYETSRADRLLDTVYGDHPHANDGCHLDGSIPSDRSWQRRWKRIAQISPTHYDVPKGKVGRRFVATLAREFRGARERSWNSERPLIFATVILQTKIGVRRAKDIRARLTTRMDLWDQGFHAALVDDTEAEATGRPAPARAPDGETQARNYNARVLSGRLRAAVRNLTRREGGGVLDPDSLDSKTGRPVLEVLHSKHPAMRTPEDEDIGEAVFEEYPNTPTPIPLDITAETVEAVATKMSGAAGPGGTDAVALQNWLLRFGSESERLRQELADWTKWLATDHPPWAAYRAMMACRLVALDKQPGVRPVGIGEIYRRLLAKCVISAVGSQATAACSNYNLCAGLPAGIEGAVHAVRQAWTANLPPPPQPTPAEPMLEQGPCTQPPAPPAPADPNAALMVDASNGFNELGRKAALWTVYHLWTGGARFASNCYRHAAQLILRRQGQDCIVLLSQEGVTQGDPLSMIIYGIALRPLSAAIRKAVPTVLQPWYADDMAMVGPCRGIARAMTLLEELGPARGYFPEPSKSLLISRPEEQAQARQSLSEFDFTFVDGHRYVGGFIGTRAARDAWLESQLDTWLHGVAKLSQVALRFPQTAYAGLAKSLQSEWQYLQRVLPNAGPAFAPVEEALATQFLPALLQEPEEIGPSFRDLLALPARKAGLGVPDPQLTAASCHSASKACTAELTRTLRAGTELDVNVHAEQASRARRRILKAKNTAEDATLDRLFTAARPNAVRRMKRARETGAWLTALPNAMNGTELSEVEFRDNLRLRFGLQPLALPTRCDGCDSKFTVDHAFSCKKGGLVLLRHNDVAAEWHTLCAAALTPSAVSDEPLILTGRDAAAPSSSTDPPPDLRGDVAVHGFWKRGTTAIFDIRVTDTDAPSARSQDPAKILKRHEREKRDKYLDLCLVRRRHFTPLVFSVDGMRGTEAQAASKRLATHLSKKWKRTYSEVCGFVRSRLSMALARSASQCLRGSRDPSARKPSYHWDTGSGLGLYR
jgi:hypothetical protein